MELHWLITVVSVWFVVILANLLVLSITFWAPKNHRGATCGIISFIQLQVDIIATRKAKGYSFYRDHLPVLGKAARKSSLEIGDKVKIELDAEAVQLLQLGHGGWNDRMKEVAFAKIIHFILYLWFFLPPISVKIFLLFNVIFKDGH